MEDYPEAPYFIPLIWQGNSGDISPHYTQRGAIYGVGGIPHSQWGGTYSIVGGSGTTMFSQYRTRYNAMVGWESPLEIELLLNPDYQTITADITVTGEISSSNNKVIFILTNYQNADYFCSVITYDEYDFSLTEPGETGTFTHILNPGSYNIDNITINVLVQTLSPDYQILQAGRVIVAEETVPLHVESIDFGAVSVGETGIQVLQIFNYGDTELTGMMFPPVGFSSPGEFSVSAHSIADYEIEFIPQQAMNYSDILIVTTDHPDHPNFFIEVTGEGLPGNSVESNDLSPQLKIRGNYPNPFNPETAISYTLVRAGRVSLSIYNIRGEQVSNLLSEEKAAGEHRVSWDAKGMAGGVYLVKLICDDEITEHKMILLK